MRQIAGIKIENAASMNELERLEAAFLQITNTAIHQLENDLQIATAMTDQAKRKLYQVQINMYKHNQSIFDLAKKFAVEEM